MKSFKKLWCIILTAVMLTTLLPVTAFAAISVPAKQTFYMSSLKGYSYLEVEVDGMTKKQSIDTSSIKSSNKNIFEPVYIYHNKSSFTGTYLFDKKTNKDTEVWSNINLEVKKPGTAKLTFKIGNKSYSSNLTFKKYVNPLKSITITGVNGGKNFASKFKADSNISMKGSSKKGSIKISAATGWKISRAFFNQNNNTENINMYSSKGVSSVTVPMTSGIKSGKPYYLSVTLVNEKDGGTLNLSVNIN